MPEVQSSTQSNGQVTQRFIEFIMMQAQQAAFCLGKIPNPMTGDTTINLEGARMFIDYLELLRDKTRGNLTKEEETILTQILTDLQLTFVQVSEQKPEPASSLSEKSDDKKSDHEVTLQKDEAKIPSSTAAEEDHEKKFSKSYGA